MPKRFVKQVIMLFVLCCVGKFETMFARRELTNDDIQSIYDTYVKVNYCTEYLHRYDRLPLEKNKKTWDWKDKDLGRVIALLEFERFIKEHNISAEKALDINGFDDPEWTCIAVKHVEHIFYDTNPNKFDLHRLDLPEKDFDFVMVNQTLEHLYDPIHCLENIYKHMRSGGILYFNVPANNLPHCTPFHFYTGFTPTGVGAMVKMAGFKILHIGQWGNCAYIKKMFETNGWPDYRSCGNSGNNEILCPFITWIFAQK